MKSEPGCVRVAAGAACAARSQARCPRIRSSPGEWTGGFYFLTRNYYNNLRVFRHIPKAPGAGFTLVELLSVIAIIGVLAGILVPVGMFARSTARSARCASNLRQLGAAVMLYVQDNSGELPLALQSSSQRGWDYFLGEAGHVGARKQSGKWVSPVFGCPLRRAASDNPDVTTYGMNGTLTGSTGGPKLATLDRPGATLLMADGNPLSNGNFNIAFWQSVNKPLATHGDKANLLFADGHVEARRETDIPLGRWPVGSSQWLFWTGRSE